MEVGRRLTYWLKVVVMWFTLPNTLVFFLPNHGSLQLGNTLSQREATGRTKKSGVVVDGELLHLLEYIVMFEVVVVFNIVRRQLWMLW